MIARFILCLQFYSEMKERLFSTKLPTGREMWQKLSHNFVVVERSLLYMLFFLFIHALCLYLRKYVLSIFAWFLSGINFTATIYSYISERHSKIEQNLYEEKTVILFPCGNFSRRPYSLVILTNVCVCVWCINMHMKLLSLTLHNYIDDFAITLLRDYSHKCRTKPTKHSFSLQRRCLNLSRLSLRTISATWGSRYLGQTSRPRCRPCSFRAALCGEKTLPFGTRGDSMARIFPINSRGNVTRSGILHLASVEIARIPASLLRDNRVKISSARMDSYARDTGFIAL